MPAKTEKQRRAAGAALAAKRGRGKVGGAAKEMAKTMSEKQLRDFVRKPRK